MAKGYATRRYQLTINNPQEHGYDHNVIKAALEKGAKLLYWCMADEVGQEETYHIHLFLVYENPVMFTTLKNKFPTAHIEVPQWGKIPKTMLTSVKRVLSITRMQTVTTSIPTPREKYMKG